VFHFCRTSACVRACTAGMHTLPFYKNSVDTPGCAQSVEHTQSLSPHHLLKMVGVQRARMCVCVHGLSRSVTSQSASIYCSRKIVPAVARVICCVMTNGGDGIYAYIAGQYLCASRPVCARACAYTVHNITDCLRTLGRI
jgi:hypothetical protein